MKIVVFDDDPTGSQTVHGCLLILSWDVDGLRRGLRHPSPIFFVLANTRALMPKEAAQRNREICNSLRQAIRAEGLNLEDILVVSRGDSTLRGHGTLEPTVIEEELGPFAATLHIPAFLEGGRTTVEGVHFLNGIPVHESSFGKDNLFGYTTSDLTSWLEEKSEGRIKKGKVRRISLAQLDAAAESVMGMHSLEALLGSFQNNQQVVVDAEKTNQLMALGKAVRKMSTKKRFLFRSAASFLNGLADLTPKLLEFDALTALRRNDFLGNPLSGLVVVGSHVPLADAQLECLLQEPSCKGVEIEVERLAMVLDSPARNSLLDDLEKYWLNQLFELLDNRKTPVLYTSRGELQFSTARARLEFGLHLAQQISKLVMVLAPKLGYLISKGGITTHTILEKGFCIDAVTLEGQLLPGLSIVRPLACSCSINLPIVTFPGNLGDNVSLLAAWRLLESC